MVIGLTGGIGAGKSVVARILRCMGYSVYDCDIEARRIMENSIQLKSDIRNLWGSECIAADGTLDRKAISRHVFGDSGKRKWLNSRVHGLVREDIRRFLALHEAKVEADGIDRPVFIESAILNTGGITQMVDEVWLVTASERTRLSRVCARDSAAPEAVLARMEAQNQEFVDFGDRPVVIIINQDDACLLENIEKLIKRYNYA